MNNLIGKSKSILREEGLREFAKTASSFVRWKLYSDIKRPLNDIYWNQYETQDIEVGRHTATFKATSEYQGGRVRFTIKRERDILTDFVSELRPEHNVFDVGSNLGVYSCFAQNVVESGKIVAIEPNQSNLRILSENIKLNGSKSAIIEEKAASNQNQTVAFDTGTESVTEGECAHEVEAVLIDDLVQREDIPFPNVVKIDVEGYEPRVLDGMADILSDSRCQIVYCEVHEPADHRPSAEDFGSSCSDIKSTLQGHGFETEQLKRTGKEVHIKAIK